MAGTSGIAAIIGGAIAAVVLAVFLVLIAIIILILIKFKRKTAVFNLQNASQPPG